MTVDRMIVDLAHVIDEIDDSEHAQLVERLVAMRDAGQVVRPTTKQISTLRELYARHVMGTVE